jgi:hypothetical protein
MRLPPFLGAQPDPEREADGPIARDNTAVVIDHEDRAVGLWPIGKDFRDFVVAVEDRFDGAQFGAVLVQRRLTAAEDQRYPLVWVNKAGGGDERRDQTVDRADADGAIATGTAQDLVEFGVAERVCHAANSPLRLHAHGISSSRRLAGHRLTSLVSTSVR